jgi:hypothetical protein
MCVVAKKMLLTSGIFLLNLVLQGALMNHEAGAAPDDLPSKNTERFGGCVARGTIDVTSLVDHPPVEWEYNGVCNENIEKVEQGLQRRHLVFQKAKDGGWFLWSVWECLPFFLDGASWELVLRLFYPKGVFGRYDRVDCMLVNFSFPKEQSQLLSDKRLHGLGCLVGCLRSMLIKRVNHFSCNSGTRYANLYEKVSEVFANGKKALEDNVSAVRKKVSQPLSDNDKCGLAMSIPIELPFSDCSQLIKRLSLDDIFLPRSPEEIVLSLHLAPHKTSWRPWRPSSPDCTSEERDIFLRCLLGAIRSQTLEDCRECSSALLSRYLGLSNDEPPSGLVNGRIAESNPKILHYKTELSAFLREEYGKSGISIDPEMIKCAPPDWSKVPDLHESLKTAFSNRGDDGVFSMPTDDAVALVLHLFPEGMFHMFNGAEYVLMNFLQPSGRPLTDVERPFWMECLVGTQRSLYINKNIAHPLEYFDWEKHLPKIFESPSAPQKDQKKKKD